MPGFRRTDRLNRLLREELARLMRRDLKDPRVRTATVTAVRATRDLAHATVYVRVLGDEVPLEEALQGLRSAAGYLRGRLGRELHLRRVPELHFEADQTLEQALRIEELLRQARTETHAEGSDGNSD